jgi:hypothetical protein
VALTSDSCYKGLPKNTQTPGGGGGAGGQDVVDFRGWPKLLWMITEHLSKPPKDWSPPPRLTDDSIAYIEYSTDKEGSVKGVTISRQSVLSHCRALTMAMDYVQGGR